MRNFKQVDEKYSFTLDNKQIAFLATGALALFLLFFVLGVLYGKGLGKGGSAASVVAAAAPAAKAEQEAQEAQESEETAGAAPAKPGERVFQLEESDISARAAPAAPKAPAREPAKVAAAIPPPSETASRESPPAPAAARGRLKGIRLSAMKGGYTIQVASFTDSADAKKLAKKLEGQGYPAYTTKASVRGRLYYRVRIGRFAANSEAQAQAASFKQAEKMDAMAMRIE